jgi:hypothetical protein
MSKLWLTYAWVDNEDSDVDHVIVELRKVGFDVYFDRRQIVVGQRLWPQIDKFISDQEQTDAWAIFATKHSLASEACQEELAYALDRALRVRGSDFPLIGIFPAPIDRSLIPSSIATRKYVDLRNPDWAAEVHAGATKQSHEPDLGGVQPYIVEMHKEGKVLEIRPRSGRWYPFRILVPAAERPKLKNAVTGPKGYVPGATITASA